MYKIGDWELRWLGHDSFQLKKSDLVVYIDPYQVSGLRADIILVSHEHHDHFDPNSIARLKKPGTMMIGPAHMAQELGEKAVLLEPGQSYQGNNFSIQSVPAYNINKDFHPKEKKNLGFVLSLDGKHLYHTGDTDLIPEMSQLGTVDVALLPVSGTYVMTAEEAVEAVKLIKPRVAIPMHYGSLIGTPEDAERFKDLASPLTHVAILEKEGI